MRPDAGDAWKLVLIMALWAACFPLISVLLPLSPHLTLAALRAGIAGATLVLIGLIAGRALPKSTGEWRSIALTGFGATTLGFVGMVHAAAEVTPGVASVVANAQPVFAAPIAYVLLRERLSPRGIAGLISGFAGVILLAAPAATGQNPGYPIGIAYLAMAAVGVAVGNVLMKQLSGSTDSVMATGLQLLIGSVPLAAAAYFLEGTETVNGSVQFWALVAVLALAGTALPYWLWFSVLERVPLSRANTWTFLVAPLGLVVGGAFFGERLGALSAGGVGLIVVGIWLAQGGKNPKEHQVSPEIK